MLGKFLFGRKRINRKLTRYGEIISRLGAYGFDDLVARLGIRTSHRGSTHRSPIDEPRAEARVRLLLEELGPTFVKLGQIMSLRSDLFPESLTSELRKLQDAAPSFSGEKAVEILEVELGRNLGDMFREFDIEPVAAASISQVHRAITTNGHEVAVKIKRPGVDSIVESDLEVLRDLARLAEHYAPALREYRPVQLVEDFRKSLLIELDLRNEARNVEQFRRSFHDDPEIKLIEIYPELSGHNVLTMEFVQGVALSDVDRLSSEGYDPKIIAARGARYILKQIFVLGMFNADPHPGNLFATGDNVIAPIDFGMIGYIDREMQHALLTVLQAFSRLDADRMTRIFLTMGFIDASVDLNRFRHDLNRIIHSYHSVVLADLSAQRMFSDLTEVMRDHKVAFPSELALTLKVILTVEGLGRQLDPRFNILTAAQPFVTQQIGSRVNLKEAVEGATELVYDLWQASKNLPFDAAIIARKIRSDDLRIKLDHRNLEGPTGQIERSLNRLAFSIVTAGLLVGSSLVSQLDVGPRLLGIPVIGLAGYAVSGVLALWLLISIIRSRRF